MKYLFWIIAAGVIIYISPRLLINYLFPLSFSCNPTSILPGIYKIEGPAAKSKNVYILTDGPLTVIDPGLFYSPRCIKKAVNSLGYKITDIKYIILTHYHIDHAGSAGALRDLSGATVIASSQDKMYIEGELMHSYPRAPWYLRFGLSLIHLLMHNYDCRVDLTVEDGDLIPILSGVKVIFTPGHTPGGISLYCEDRRILFSGDALQYSNGQLTRAKTIYSHDLEADVESIRHLSTLEFECILPGDGQPLLEGASELAKEYVRKLIEQKASEK